MTFFISVLLLQATNGGHDIVSTRPVLHGSLRSLLSPRVYTLPLVRAIGRTMVQGKNYGPQITVKRLSTK